MFKSSYFKKFMEFRTTNFGYQHFHQLMLRHVQTNKINEILVQIQRQVCKILIRRIHISNRLKCRRFRRRCCC
ncbi:hypothetical protein ACS0TY_032674 [Phlomoides rotata]